MIKAVDDYQDLLRVSVASAGNDHRLGANEAPPAIVSIFLGDELTEILNALENDTLYTCKGQTLMEIGATVLPHFPKDTTDRNRTSPFAFTGNKFEFRMLGSAFSIAGPIIVLNSIVADVLSQFADELENSTDFKSDLGKLIKRTIKDHRRCHGLVEFRLIRIFLYHVFQYPHRIRHGHYLLSQIKKDAYQHISIPLMR